MSEGHDRSCRASADLAMWCTIIWLCGSAPCVGDGREGGKGPQKQERALQETRRHEKLGAKFRREYIHTTHGSCLHTSRAVYVDIPLHPFRHEHPQPPVRRVVQNEWSKKSQRMEFPPPPLSPPDHRTVRCVVTAPSMKSCSPVCFSKTGNAGPTESATPRVIATNIATSCSTPG